MCNTKNTKNQGSTSTDKNEIEECGICKKQVGEEDQGLECEICKKWWHSGCVDIQDSEYEMLARHCKGTIHWYCPLCNGKTLQMMKLIQELNEKITKNELELQTINNDIQAKMQTISTVLDDIQSDMAKMKVDIDSGLAQHTVITEIKEEINEVKSQSFVDIVKQEVEKVEGEVNVVKQTITETRENAEEERDKETRRNNIIIYRMKESAAASAELRRQDDFVTLVALLDNVFEVSYKDGDIN